MPPARIHLRPSVKSSRGEVAARHLHSENFKDDPVLTYFVHHVPTSQRQEMIASMFKPFMRAAALNNAIFDEAYVDASDPNSNSELPDDSEMSSVMSTPACSAVWMHPGRTVDNWRTLLPAGLFSCFLKLGPVALKRILWEFQTLTDAAKSKHLYQVNLVTGKKARREYYYLFFLSTQEKCRGQGVGAAVVQRFLDEVATKEGLPVWLEATTAGSRRLYARLGFEECETWRLGEGVVGADGLKKRNGEGVPIWGMLWTPGKTDGDS